jgi:hypothetical protein
MDKIHRIQLPPQRKGEIILERHPVASIELDQIISNAIGPNGIEQGLIGKTFKMKIGAPRGGYWSLPLHTNKDRTLGTFLYLYDDGKIERITIREDEGDTIDLIKPADKDCK